ncbi:hypothetical protein U1Q18_004638 [Sarracenia purpurea var. burkii]
MVDLKLANSTRRLQRQSTRHMVSVDPNPPEAFFLDSTGTALPGLGSFSTPSAPATATDSITSPPSDCPAKKVRKPYTITKSRESWAEPEHDKFLEALQLDKLLIPIQTCLDWDLITYPNLPLNSLTIPIWSRIANSV